MGTPVLHLCSSLGMYGAENVILSLAREMRASRYDPIIGVFENAQNPHTELATEAQKSGIQSVIFPCASRFDLKAILLIRNYIIKHKIALIHPHGYKSNFYGWAASLFTTTRRIATCHNWTHTSKVLDVYSHADKFLLHGFDAIVTVSDAVRQELLRRGISGKKIFTIYNGVCLERFRYNLKGDDLTCELNIPSRCKVVGTVGRLSSEKGLSYLLAAGRTVLTNFPDTVFLIVGEGPIKSDLMKECSSLGIEKHVIFTGGRNDVEKLYSAMDIFVLPSLNEGLPMSLLEAMASQKPVISTGVGAISHVIDHGKNGLLVKVGDVADLAAAIESLLKDPNRAEGLAHNGCERVAGHFSSGAMAGSYLRLYDEVLRGQ